MCADRCFSSPNESETSSDYTKTTKQKTIYTDIVKQVQSQTNFIKSNGVNYNENFGLHNNCLAFAKSYDLLLDVTKGKYLCSPTEDPNWVSNESWSAGLYSVDYSANGVNVVVDTSYNAGNGNHVIFPMTQPAFLADISWNGLYPGVIVDPSYNIFYNECNDQNNWRKKLVDMSFNNTNYYIQSKQQSEQLYGMYYPSNVSFGVPICGEIIDISTIATNVGGNNWVIVANKTIERCQILNIDNGTRIDFNSGITLTVKGQLNNKGTIVNDDGIIYNLGGTITNNGGTINTYYGIINNNGGLINNNGGLIRCVISGKIYTNNGGTIDNTGGTINLFFISQINEADGSQGCGIGYLIGVMKTGTACPP